MKNKWVQLDIAKLESQILELDMTELDVAREARISARTWHRITGENGYRTTFQNCCAIAYVLGISPDVLSPDIAKRKD